MKIDLNKWLKLEATERTARFVPYKENFVTPVAKGESLYLKAKTVGQYLYYVKNGFVAVEETPVKSETVNVINVPAKIVITNNTDKVMNFIPYRENFQVEVKPANMTKDGVAESYEFEVETAGQVLYYMSQDTTGVEIDGGLDVNQDATTAAAKD